MQRRRDVELFLSEHGRHEKNEKILFLLWISCLKMHFASMRLCVLIS